MVIFIVFFHKIQGTSLIMNYFIYKRCVLMKKQRQRHSEKHASKNTTDPMGLVDQSDFADWKTFGTENPRK